LKNCKKEKVARGDLKLIGSSRQVPNRSIVARIAFVSIKHRAEPTEETASVVTIVDSCNIVKLSLTDETPKVAGRIVFPGA